MRKIIVSEYVTADGIMEDPGGSENTPFGGWSFDFWSEAAAAYKYKELMDSDALLLGRSTYEGFAAAWPTMEGTGDFGEKMNGIEKYVVTSKPLSIEWNNSRVIHDSFIKHITELKQKDGKNILVAGSAQLVSLLLEHGLADEYNLMVHPVILGTGKRLFSNVTTRKNLELISSQELGKGVIVLSYSPVP